MTAHFRLAVCRCLRGASRSGRGCAGWRAGRAGRAGGVVVEAVCFARHGARFTRDIEDLVAWPATRTDKTAICRLTRVNWRTVGAIVARVVADEFDAHCLDDLYEVGIDEVSYRKQHHYLTIVADHRTGQVVWCDEGKDTAAAERFYDALGEARSHQLRAVSMDMGKAYPKVTRQRAPQAVICWDPYHVVAMATRELDVVRRAQWNHLRATTDTATAKRFKGARWALLKRPEDLSERQADQLAALRRAGGKVWRAYQLKEALRALFAGDLSPAEAAMLLDRWDQLGATLPHPRVRRPGLHHPRRPRRDPRRHPPRGHQRTRRGSQQPGTTHHPRRVGFYSANAVAALVMLSCGPNQPHSATRTMTQSLTHNECKRPRICHR